MTRSRTALDGVRVVDLSTGIAGGYATKLLADAGADVIKVEPRGGDPLRRWSASGQRLDGCDGALFRFLHTSKRSVVDRPSGPASELLLSQADLVFESGILVDDVLGDLLAAHPHLAVVSISPFGRTGSYRHRPATEFTLQAWCGSVAGRGPGDRPPLHAGGQLGEWVTGTYAAVAGMALALARVGGHVDVSMLECMTPTLGGFGALLAAFSGKADAARRSSRPSRNLETPSIVPTKDGLVGFCTVTGQQFQDFLALIDRADLIGDERYASMAARTHRREEFDEMVAAWARSRTTAEIVDLATAFRIPVTPVGTPESITAIDHFVERGVFVRNPGGGFVQPRVPYRIHGIEPRPFAPAPYLDQHGQDPTWLDDERCDDRRPTAPPDRPLAGLRIVDLTAFWAGPCMTQLLASLGAEVIKVEGPNRPDGMRSNSAKPPSEPDWWEWSAIFHAVNTNKRAVTLDLATDEGRALLLRLVAQADALVENFSPRVLDGFGLTYDAVHRVNPQAILVRMPGFGLDGPWRDRAGFAQTMEQLCGMAWVTGYPDRLPVIPRGVCDPLAGMHAAFAVLVALAERERSDTGRLVEVSMIEAALNCAAEVVIEQRAYRSSLMRAGNRGPAAAPQGVYGCAGEEAWLALAVRDDADWERLVAVLGDPGWATDERFGSKVGRREHHDELDERLAEAFAGEDLESIVQRTLDAGVPVAPVLPAVRAIEDGALRSRGFVEPVHHPMVGTYEVMGLPFRLSTRSSGWVERPAPMLGQDDLEVLTGALGLTEGDIDDLAQRGVVRGGAPVMGIASASSSARRARSEQRELES